MRIARRREVTDLLIRMDDLLVEDRDGHNVKLNEEACRIEELN